MSLAAQLAAVPAAPGVYLWKDRAGRVLYVGKALSLRDRVGSYLVGGSRPRAAAGLAPRTAALVADVLAGGSLEVTETRDEDGALLLEEALIRQHRPPYNVRLREGQALPYLHLTLDEEYPRLAVLREGPIEGRMVLGPYRTARRAQVACDLLLRAVPLRPCLGRRPGRPGALPCLDHELGRCPAAPCVERPGLPAYPELVRQMQLVLSGRAAELVLELEAAMAAAAGAEEFEQAAWFRDRLRAVGRLDDAEIAAPAAVGQTEAIALVAGLDQGVAHVHRLVQAAGRVADRGSVCLEGELPEDPAELMLQAILALHPGGEGLAEEVVCDLDAADRARLEQRISDLAGRRVAVSSPARGDRRRLYALARQNARRERDHWTPATRLDAALAALADVLGLAGPPRRIECMDISNLQGREAVAAITVFIDGTARRGEHMRLVLEEEGPDDYAWLAEAATRRLDPDGPYCDLPLADLVVVDGGPGQLQAVKAVYDAVAATDLRAAGVQVISLAKRHEEVFLPGESEPLRLRDGDPARLLLQQVRDETHHTAISAHRRRRGAALVRTPLDAIPGIGPARRQALVQRFGSAEAALAASEDELSAVPGISRALARRIHGGIHGG